GIGSFAFLVDDLHAIDAAIALVDQLEVVLFTICPGNAQWRERARAVSQQRNELLFCCIRRASGTRHGYRDTCRQGRRQFECTLHLLVLLVSMHRLYGEPAGWPASRLPISWPGPVQQR